MLSCIPCSYDAFIVKKQRVFGNSSLLEKVYQEAGGQPLTIRRFERLLRRFDDSEKFDALFHHKCRFMTAARRSFRHTLAVGPPQAAVDFSRLAELLTYFWVFTTLASVFSVDPSGHIGMPQVKQAMFRIGAQLTPREISVLIAECSKCSDTRPWEEDR